MEQKKLEDTITKRTEEVQDIINRMPNNAGIYVTVGLVFFAALMLFFGFRIKYPESVSGVVTIRAQQSPVRITSPATGRLHLLVGNNNEVGEGELIAYIENSTKVNAFMLLDSFMCFNPFELQNIAISAHKNLELGELTSTFLQLVNNVEVYKLYNENNPYSHKINQINVKIEGNKNLLSIIDEQVKVENKSVEIQKTNTQKDSIQYHKLNSINESAYLQGQTMYLSALQGINALKKEQGQLRGAIAELGEQKEQLLVEQQEHEQTLTMKLLFSYEELKSQMAQWKQKYAFVAPYSGRVEMLNFWKDNSFLQMGEEAFAIVPLQNRVRAQVVIPAVGAGKVKAGQEVLVKLDDFPYIEFGAIKGKVADVSMLSSTNADLMAKEKILTYLVNVELPRQLETNYGSALNFKHDMKGVAQILVKKRRLIERLFDNLKYMMNE